MSIDSYNQIHLTAIEDVMEEIKNCNAIRYPSYRTAAKIQILHKKLHMQYVPLKHIIGVFERHKLSVTENSVTLDETEIEDVISDIYFAAQKETNVDFDVDYVTKLSVNCVLCTFTNRRKVSVFSIKVLLTLLSCGNLHEKYEYWYQLLADHNACLSKAALHMMLMNLCKVTEFIGESVAFGSHLVQSNIDKCFIESQGCLGVSKMELRLWLMQDPSILSWVATFHRLKSAENIVHKIKCSSCKVDPLRGPCFSCLKCARYHQCQNCFFFGKISNKHKLKHPVKEYCNQTSTRQHSAQIVNLIKNKLRLCPTQASLPSISPSPDAISYFNGEDRSLDTISLASTLTREKVTSDPQKELSSIINHLEQENKQLQIELREICGSRAERLQRHRQTIESQLHRLKILKKYLFNRPQRVNRVQSTPMLPTLPMNSRFLTLPEFQLSPIGRQDNNRKQTTLKNNKSGANQSMYDSQYEYSNTDGELTSSVNVPQSSAIELSTWMGGNRTSIDQQEGDFSKWLNRSNCNLVDTKYSVKSLDTNSCGDSPTSVQRDNTPSTLQRPDKHSRHSSLQNIQGDLNDILNRLQNMVANDCLLEAESFSANDNCQLKRAATEMEDLLTGLIEGMESRKGKLTTIV
ncbi:hypothetical protein PV326_007215 [Microctonus aethiopoides]|nr:hypothetical protein PV326_007215 [Microctonus aethiopoides]